MFLDTVSSCGTFILHEATYSTKHSVIPHFRARGQSFHSITPHNSVLKDVCDIYLFLSLLPNVDLRRVSS